MTSKAISTGLGLFLALGAAANSWPVEPPAWDERDRYREQEVEGWTVLVHGDLFEPPRLELRTKSLRLLEDHLFRIGRVVPDEALSKLRQVPIWVEVAHPRHPCMCYHPSADWLREHGMNPEKAQAVELANCENFLEWTHDQPWMVLHELAHAYHDRVLGREHEGIRRAYEAAVKSGTYERVLHIRGSTERHYAMSNDQEYFAEATEAWFGTNDFYPFVRAELERHDPDLVPVLSEAWGGRL
jgi:hypothetical protein